MKSFGIAVTFVLAAIGAGVGALPTGGEALARRDGNFFYPYGYPATNGPIYASGANGGYNYFGNGANGGTISINRRGEDFFFYPIYSYPVATANGPISASGANGGYNYFGNGANGGSISINRRGEAEKNLFFWPSWPSFLWPSEPAAPTSGEALAVDVVGASDNSGTNLNADGGDGDGANDDTISVDSRATDSDNFWPSYRPWSTAANGPISAYGANGGYNYGGDGANGGSISINGRRDEEIRVWPWGISGGSQNSVSGSNSGWNSGQIGTMQGGGGFQNSVSGVNSGVNSGTIGAMW